MRVQKRGVGAIYPSYAAAGPERLPSCERRLCGSRIATRCDGPAVAIHDVGDVGVVVRGELPARAPETQVIPFDSRTRVRLARRCNLASGGINAAADGSGRSRASEGR